TLNESQSKVYMDLKSMGFSPSKILRALSESDESQQIDYDELINKVMSLEDDTNGECSDKKEEKSEEKNIKKRTASESVGASDPQREEKIRRLTELGFEYDKAKFALEATQGNYIFNSNLIGE